MEWDCYATNMKLPNNNTGINVTERFSWAFYVGWILGLMALCTCIANVVCKFFYIKILHRIAAFIELFAGLLYLFWLCIAGWIRMEREGRVCAGATNMVSKDEFPYAYTQGEGLYLAFFFGTLIPVSLCVLCNCGCL